MTEAGPVFRLWEVTPGQSLAPIIEGCRRGIYVLRFSDGTEYVGRSVDVVTRYATHVHGSDHHGPWRDVTAVLFRAMPTGDLDLAEMLEIRRRAARGRRLRNRVGLIGGVGPAALDEIIPVAEQRHWATGQPDYGRPLDRLARRDTGPSTLRRMTPAVYPDELYHRVLDDLGVLLTRVIPNAAELEARYWTLSDHPATAGGRLATLSAGVLELAYIPRRPSTWTADPANAGTAGSPAPPPMHWTAVNLPAGLLLPEDTPAGHGIVGHLGPDRLPHQAIRREYPLMPADALLLPTGRLGQYLDTEPEALTALRTLAIDLMRARGSGIFRRHHSRGLTTEVARQAAAATKGAPPGIAGRRADGPPSSTAATE